MAREHSIDLVSIHPSLIMGTVYSSQSTFSVECMKVGPACVDHPQSSSVYCACLFMVSLISPVIKTADVIMV